MRLCVLMALQSAENCACGGVHEDEWDGTLGIHKKSEGVSLGFVTEGSYSKSVVGEDVRF